MLSSSEITRGLAGGWQLFKGDPNGMRAFDLSFEGFWRSFQVILLLSPLLLVLLASERALLLEQTALTPETFPTTEFVWSRIAGFVLGWIDYPVVLALLAGPLGLRGRYVPLIVAVNWASLIQAPPMAVPALLHLLGIASLDAANLMTLVVLGVMLRYQFVVTRAATGAPIGFSIGLVALDYVLSLAVGLGLSSLVGI